MSTKTDKQMAAVLTAALVIFLIGPFSITLAQDATVTSQIASIPRTSSSEVMKRPVSLLGTDENSTSNHGNSGQCLSQGRGHEEMRR